MNKLYMVRLSNWERQQTSRYLSTAKASDPLSQSLAEGDVLHDLGDGWKVENTVYVCETPDDVFVEV